MRSGGGAGSTRQRRGGVRRFVSEYECGQISGGAGGGGGGG